MAAVVYILCALASTLCAALLLRGWFASRVRLLFWSAACFVGLALNNILLVVDLLLVPEVDLATVRLVPAVVGLAVLVYGLVMEEQ